MRVLPTPVDGVVVVESDVHRDERGSFERAFCLATLAAAGIRLEIRQASVSTSHLSGTLRGLHYQRQPFPEAKLVRCVAGRVFDVAVDLRPGSATYRRWAGVELAAGSGRSVYIPAGVAHGFLSLADGSILVYMMDAPQEPSAAAGVRWDDPAFGIAWPDRPRVISPRDAGYPDFLA